MDLMMAKIDGIADVINRTTADQSVRANLPQKGPATSFTIPPEDVRLGARENLQSPPEEFYQAARPGTPAVRQSVPTQAAPITGHDTPAVLRNAPTWAAPAADHGHPVVRRSAPTQAAPPANCDDDSQHGNDHQGDPPEDPFRPGHHQQISLPDREPDRGIREGTYNSAVTQTSRNFDKIKREEIGIFNPNYKDPDNLGIVQGGKNFIFTDVYSFVDRITTFTEGSGEEATHQILSRFQALLGGSANLWWNNEMKAPRRVELRNAGIFALLDKLTVRFGPDAAKATKSFYDCKLYLRDVAADEQALQNFVQKKLRWARVMKMLGTDQSNWSSAMMLIWSDMEFEIQQCLPRPDEYASLSEYLMKIERSQVIVNAAAQRHYPSVYSKKSSSRSSYRSSDKVEDRQSSRHLSSRREQSRGPRREGRRDDKYRDKQRDRSRHENHRRDREERHDLPRRDDDCRDRESKDDRRRDDKGKPQRDDRYRKDYNRDRKDRGHFADGHKPSDPDANLETDPSDSSSEVSYSSDTEGDGAYIVLDTKLSCRRCHKHFNTKTELRWHVKGCKVIGPLRAQRNHQANLEDRSRRTCGHCGELFSSRNALFKHLKLCGGAKDGIFDRPADPDTKDGETATAEPLLPSDNAVNALEEFGEINYVKEAPAIASDETMDSPLGNFTYLRVNARASPKGEDIEVRFDPGASRSVVGRNFLNHLEHTIVKRKGRISGVGKGSQRLKEWAIFTLYLPGIEEGKRRCSSLLAPLG